eukprot:gene1654-1841_t
MAFHYNALCEEALLNIPGVLIIGSPVSCKSNAVDLILALLGIPDASVGDPSYAGLMQCLSTDPLPRHWEDVNSIKTIAALLKIHSASKCLANTIVTPMATLVMATNMDFMEKLSKDNDRAQENKHVNEMIQGSISELADRRTTINYGKLLFFSNRLFDCRMICSDNIYQHNGRCSERQRKEAKSCECLLLSDNNICKPCKSVEKYLRQKLRIANNVSKKSLSLSTPLHTAAKKKLINAVILARAEEKSLNEKIKTLERRIVNESVNIDSNMHNDLRGIIEQNMTSVSNNSFAELFWSKLKHSAEVQLGLGGIQ